MSLDWSILHWIQNMLVCPALNFLMPKITLLGNGGMIWLLASGVLICTKNIGDRASSCYAVWLPVYWWEMFF